MVISVHGLFETLESLNSQDESLLKIFNHFQLGKFTAT